jgi:hypothetical protein
VIEQTNPVGDRNFIHENGKREEDLTRDFNRKILIVCSSTVFLNQQTFMKTKYLTEKSNKDLVQFSLSRIANRRICSKIFLIFSFPSIVNIRMIGGFSCGFKVFRKISDSGLKCGMQNEIAGYHGETMGTSQFSLQTPRGFAHQTNDHGTIRYDMNE